MKFRHYFGVDKQIIGTLKVRSIDFDKLESNSNVKVSYQGDVRVETIDRNTGEYRSFTSITISKDKKFGKLILGCKKNGGKKVEYVKLEVHVADEEGSNLVPLSVDEVKAKHKEILKHINKKYGIDITDKEAKYTYLEINKTVELEADISEYNVLMEVLQFLVPKRYRDGAKVQRNSDGSIRFVSYDNKSMRIKIYNKTKQLEMEKKIKLDKLYFRIEVCLIDEKKIKTVFGTNLVEAITDEMIERYYMETVKADVFDGLDEYIAKSNKELKKELKLEKKADAKKYPKQFLKGACGLKYKNNMNLDLVFDIEQVLEILKADVSRWDRTYKTLQVEIEKRPYKKNNLVRYNEIKSKILNVKC